MRVSRIALAGALIALVSLPSGAAPLGKPGTLPPSVPAGFAVTVAGVAPTPTSLSFSPDGRSLYVATSLGQVLRYPVLAKALLGAPKTFVSGLGQSLGVLATNDGVFVSGLETSGTQAAGVVKRARDTDGNGKADVVETVISGLHNGRHNTNGMAIGPDGILYLTNGSSTDSGFGAEGGTPEVPPFTGSVLRVDPNATDLTPVPSMVVATGFRNIYDVAFFPPGHPATGSSSSVVAVPMNGPDGQTYNGVVRPAGEDTLNLFDVTGPTEHFGFPWCLYDRRDGGLNGFAQDPLEGSCDPLPPAATATLPGPAVQAKPSALFGLHVSADGLAFNPGTSFPAAYDHDLFVAEFGNFFGTVPAGHKIVRVRFDATGAVSAVTDFMTGVLPLDVTFANDGSLWVADFSGLIYRVANLLPRSSVALARAATGRPAPSRQLQPAALPQPRSHRCETR